MPPLLSRAASPPPEDGPTVTPFVSTPNRSVANFGFAAAARVLTTSTSEKPSGWAVTWRSTPGRTSWYVAVEPFTTGAGSFPGQETSRRRDPSRSVANGPSPPLAEKTIGSTVARGMMPSAVTFNVVSTGTQDPPLRTRVGSIVCSSVREPSTLAKVCDHSVRSERISTRRPQVATILRAACPSGCSSTHVPLSGAAAATGVVGTPIAVATATTAVTPANQRRTSPERPREMYAGVRQPAIGQPPVITHLTLRQTVEMRVVRCKGRLQHVSTRRTPTSQSSEESHYT
ncbi:hypothetical protein E1258_18755 [Micromonospora sp. KC207]|nr:hypothetical protein E1258_18755 [Micromonospora sp. KC207]